MASRRGSRGPLRPLVCFTPAARLGALLPWTPGALCAYQTALGWLLTGRGAVPMPAFGCVGHHPPSEAVLKFGASMVD